MKIYFWKLYNLKVFKKFDYIFILIFEILVSDFNLNFFFKILILISKKKRKIFVQHFLNYIIFRKFIFKFFSQNFPNYIIFKIYNFWGSFFFLSDFYFNLWKFIFSEFLVLKINFQNFIYFLILKKPCGKSCTFSKCHASATVQRGHQNGLMDLFKKQNILQGYIYFYKDQNQNRPYL